MAEFTKEQLSELARENVRVLTLAAKQHPGQPVIAMDLRLAEIALAVLTAPQLPQPAVVVDRKAIADRVHGQCSRIPGATFYNAAELALDEVEACRAAMLQGAEPVSETDNTTQQFESLGLIVTSDERKMELPHCSKHPGTELLVHPFEQLLSYPPQPVMYCPLCRPSVAKWVEFDNQLRQWKGVK